MADSTPGRVIAASPAPDWITVCGGWFELGGGRPANEHPRHRVFVKPFVLARTPVLHRDYAAFLAATGHREPPEFREPAFDHPTKPAVGLSWHDAASYCAWLSELLCHPVRLPTEAEWECAARADRAHVTYPWGDEPPEARPDYANRWLDGPEPVDLFPAQHPRGFVGLGENIHEWCADWYDKDFYAVSPAVCPRGPATGKRRASRGGSWRHAVKGSTCTARSSIPPNRRYLDYGMRIAADSSAGDRFAEARTSEDRLPNASGLPNARGLSKTEE